MNIPSVTGAGSGPAEGQGRRLLVLTDDDFDNDGWYTGPEPLGGNDLVDVDIEIRATRAVMFRGSLQVTGKITVGESISVELDLLAGGDITAGWTITAGRRIRAGGDIAAGWDISADWTITAGGGIQAGQRIHSGWNVAAGWGITAGRDIWAGRGIAAGRSIAAGGDITAGAALTRGDDESLIVAGTNPDMEGSSATITCRRILGGTVVRGALTTTAPHPMS